MRKLNAISQNGCDLESISNLQIKTWEFWKAKGFKLMRSGLLCIGGTMAGL